MQKEVIAKGSVELTEEASISQMVEVRDLLNNQEDIYTVIPMWESSLIDFTMGGDNNIDCNVLDRLLPEIREITDDFVINVVEFAYVGRKYWYESLSGEPPKQFE